MAGTLTISTLSDGTNSTSATNCIQGSAKAWAQFNPSAGSITLNASYNVSSVTYTANGTYVVNFTNAFADTKYTCIGSSSPDSAAYACVVVTNSVAGATYSAQTTSACPIFISRSGTGSTSTNPYIVSVAFLR
jgi:hypothetical protein